MLTSCSERMVFPLWKSLHSLNLMLPKEDRKALLLRLFNDETPLVNQTLKRSNGPAEKVELKVQDTDGSPRARNSSSPDGGVALPDPTKDVNYQNED